MVGAFRDSEPSRQTTIEQNEADNSKFRAPINDRAFRRRQVAFVLLPVDGCAPSFELVVKRFTETEKWRDPWFRKLPPRLKCLWQYICDTCDAAGVFEVDFEQASFVIGEPVSEQDFESFGGRLEQVNGTKRVISKFIPFQYSKLSDACPAHKPVFAAMRRNGITYDYPSDRVGLGLQHENDHVGIPTGKERTGKDQERTGREGAEIPDFEQAFAMTMNKAVARDFAKFVFADWSSRGGRDGANVPVEWVRYVSKRWEREKVDWVNGDHKGKPRSASSKGGNL